jgi:hypothetical protein
MKSAVGQPQRIDHGDQPDHCQHPAADPETADTVGSGTLLVEQGRGAVASVTETLESMATLVQDLSGQLAAIATATEQQSRAAQEVAGTVERLPGSAISPASMASRGADRRPPDPGDRETDIGHQPLRTGCLTQVRENGADLWVCPVSARSLVVEGCTSQVRS